MTGLDPALGPDTTALVLVRTLPRFPFYRTEFWRLPRINFYPKPRPDFLSIFTLVERYEHLIWEDVRRMYAAPDPLFLRIRLRKTYPNARQLRRAIVRKVRRHFARRGVVVRRVPDHVRVLVSWGPMRAGSRVFRRRERLLREAERTTFICYGPAI